MKEIEIYAKRSSFQCVNWIFLVGQFIFCGSLKGFTILINIITMAIKIVVAKNDFNSCTGRERIILR